MLDEDTIVVKSKKEFDDAIQGKDYFINMGSNTRTLHKANFHSCSCSKSANRFITFASMDEVISYEKTHTDATPFKRCGNCFKNRNKK